MGQLFFGQKFTCHSPIKLARSDQQSQYLIMVSTEHTEQFLQNSKVIVVSSQ